MLLFLFYKTSSNKNNLKIEILLLVLIVLCNFPLGISRYKFAVIYLPVLLIYFKPILNKQIFPLAFIVLFLTVFPYLHHFRYNNNLIPNKIIDFEMFNESHFDSYQNSINIVSNDIVTNGNQLLGSLLFFVPRSIWQNKSVGSGQVLADSIDFEGFSNVAVGYFAEGFINFGYFGTLIFIIGLGILNARLDFSYWNTSFSKNIFVVFYLVFIPFQFFILRGGFISSFANLSGFLVCIIGLNFLLNTKKAS